MQEHCRNLHRRQSVNEAEKDEPKPTHKIVADSFHLVQITLSLLQRVQLFWSRQYRPSRIDSDYDDLLIRFSQSSRHSGERSTGTSTGDKDIAMIRRGARGRDSGLNVGGREGKCFDDLRCRSVVMRVGIYSGR